MKRPSIKRMLGASLLAVIAGLLQPMAAPLAMAVCITPVLITLFFAWAGWIPAIVMTVCSVGSVAWASGVLWGVQPALGATATVLTLVLPAGVAIGMLEKRRPFFRRMCAAGLTQTAALLALVAVIYLGMKVDLVDAMTGWLRSASEGMPADMLTMVLNNFAINGMLTEESIEELTGGIVLRSDVMQVLDQAFEYMNYQMKLTMPAMLINSGILSGVLMTALPGLICARRGDEPQVDYVAMSGWFLPARAVACVAVCMLTSLALQVMEIDGAVAVTAVFSTAGGTLCLLQGVGCLSRRFKEGGRRRGMRITMIVLALMFASGFVEIVGMASALFGRRGAISMWMRRRMEESRKDDDE